MQSMLARPRRALIAGAFTAAVVETVGEGTSVTAVVETVEEGTSVTAVVETVEEGTSVTAEACLPTMSSSRRASPR
ncbi:hypothetical protein [Leucobacter sp. W1038]|uniref:hypothetical protein n=1 Tax=Leucobacter sp. W1038 TaxID=3438281 RepID=UPI003D9745B6